MIRILIVSTHYRKESPGGAAQSIINISEVLKENNDFNVEFFDPPLGKFKTLIFRLGISFYLLIPKIIREINKFKPQIIITQKNIANAAIISGRIKKIPVINIVRDPSGFCPKFVDVINYGNACPKFEQKKICYPCIDKWRTLRVLIGNKPKGWEYSLKAIISTIIYKIRYISFKLNTSLLNKAEIVLVASELMKTFLSFRINHNKIKIINVTPIKIRNIDLPSQKKNQFLFVIPSYEASHKGVDFILRLTKFIPDDYKMIIVGGLIPNSRLDGILSKVINLGQITSKELDKVYQSSKITLVPSFFTEAFGRVIIESIVNGTPVIASPNCGANYFLRGKEYLKVLPLKISLWRNTIKRMIEKPIDIAAEERKQISDQFSISRSINQFSFLIKKILNE